MSGVQLIEIKADDDGIRIDRWFKRHFPDVSFGKLQKAMRKGDVRLDGKRVKGKEHVASGQIVRVPPLASILGDTRVEKPEKKRLTAKEIQEVRNWVIHMDDDVIVINKPAGLPTQGGTGLTRHLDGLLDALRYDNASRPKLVHRLDKDTSGALLLARNVRAAAALAKSFASKDTEKTYWALVKGVPKQLEGQISMRMEKAPIKGNERMVVSDTGKHSVTDFVVVERMGQEAAWLALQPLTGRTHQLRLHCAEMGHPIIGDGKYGGSEAFLSGTISKKMHLHSYRVRFPHPAGGMEDVFAPLPPHMAASFDTLGLDLHAYEDPFLEDY